VKRALALTTGGALAALALAIPANAGIEFPITVEPNGEDRFAPGKATADVGGSVFSWNWENQDTIREHNVRQDRRLFYSGPPDDGANSPFFLSVSAGTFHYYCEPHGSESGGMDGKIRVRPNAGPSAPDDSFLVRWAIGETPAPRARAARRWGPQGPTETGNRFDVRFKVGNGNWRTWKTDTSKVRARFGRNDNPVRIRSDREYFFRVRSQKGQNDNKVSGWSPKLTVQT
jgi:plastocyanin